MVAQAPDPLARTLASGRAVRDVLVSEDVGQGRRTWLHLNCEPVHDAESGSHYRGERCRFAQDLIHLRERTLIRGTQRSAPTTPTRSPRATSACAGCPSR